MSKPRQTKSRQPELFRIPLEKIKNPKHELVLLGDKFDWSLMEQYFNRQFSDDKGGQPPLNPQLMVGLCLLKYMDNLSDEAVVKRWVDSPHYQYSRKSHAKQYKRAKRVLRRLKTILGRVIRDIRRKSTTFSQRLSWVLRRATLLFNQKKSSKTEPLWT